MAHYEHSGKAQDTTLVGDITPTSTAWTIAHGVGWPTGSTYEFWVAIDPDTSLEEHVLITSRTGTALTLASSGNRGLDGTSAAAHSAGAVVRHIWSAVEATDVAVQSVTNIFADAQHFTGGALTANTGSADLMVGAGGSTPQAATVSWGDGTGWRLSFGNGNGATFHEKIRMVDSGGLVGVGTLTYGAGAFGAASGYTQVGNTTDHALVSAQHGTLADADLRLRSKGTGLVRLQDSAANSQVSVGTNTLGFHTATPVAKQTITGSRGSNVALANLLTALETKGLITDSTT